VILQLKMMFIFRKCIFYIIVYLHMIIRLKVKRVIDESASRSKVDVAV